MNPGGQNPGTSDEQYNLVSVLYHALKAADICDIYALDAKVGERRDFYEFFREAQVAQTQLAERAKELLSISAAPAAGSRPPREVLPETDVVGPQEPPEEGFLSEAPPESGLPGDTPAGDQPERRGSPDLVPEDDVVGPEVSPEAPRKGEVPSRTGEFLPSPSEPPPRP